ncbi:btb (poz) domain-containing 2a-related [Anaeramoeba flamelloides]|uniref:Btb (Poz) domain-containing 2a-related n=1 Tax=Anaeramoeba flamelloides TaxID=1746091 RepID=A0AAV7ZHL1_9EUKA|nr:btb (poz) domain-containing 2a-related [Anaeramoeba flamelloides]
MATVISQINIQLSEYINCNDLADVKFIVGEKQYEMYGHKLILSLSSLMWKTFFFSGQWQETSKKGMVVINLPKEDPKIFEELLKYCYIGLPDFQKHNVLQIYQKADYYLMEDLKILCKNFIRKDLDEDNGVWYYQQTLLLNNKPMIKFLTHEIVKNSKVLFQKKGCLKGIHPRVVQKLLCNNHLLCDEIDLFRRICETDLDAILKKFLTSLLKYDLIGTKGRSEIKATEFGSKWLEDLKKKETDNQCSFTKAINRCLTIFPKKTIIEQPRCYKFKKKNREINVLLLAATRHRGYIRDVFYSICSQGILPENVKLFQAQKKTIKKKILHSFDCVFTFSYEPFHDSKEYGKLLSDFVESGKGLVICASDSLRKNHVRGLKGTILGRKYLPFAPGVLIHNHPSKLGKILNPHHPIMKGVTSFDGGKDTFHIQTDTIHQEGEIIAEYENGQPLIGVNVIKKDYQQNGCVVVLNIWPVSDKVRNKKSFWLPSTDGSLMISNSIVYATNC